MRVFSTKKPWRNDLFHFGFVVFVTVPNTIDARLSWDAENRFRYESRLGYHLVEPRDLASHSHGIDWESKVRVTQEWSAVMGARAYAEAAFATNGSRYGDPVRTEESSEIVPRDLYLQYKDRSILLRGGNQQVVWGETFGFYYADLINPKDFRELGITELASQRIPVPMLYAKRFLSSASLELLYIPKPYFNKIPAVGSDFAFPYRRFFPAAEITVEDQRTLPLSFGNGEWGMRGTAPFSNLDLSAFFLYYFDRGPHYRAIVSQTPLRVRFEADHSRLWSVGTTLSYDLSPFLLRGEGIFTKGKQFDTFVNGLYSHSDSDDITGVLGIDYEGIEAWRIGVQVSQISAMSDITGSLLPRHRQLLSLHSTLSFWADQSLELILSYVPTDGSTLSELRYTIPILRWLELVSVVDLFEGNESSQFGQYRNASRVYFLLRAYGSKAF